MRRWRDLLVRGRSGRSAERDGAEDEGKGDAEDGEFRGDGVGEYGLETLHGGYSLFLSAVAAMVLVGVNLVEPGHMEPEHTFGGLVGYFVGVLMCFALARREHRRRRAARVPDPFGTGRQALTIMAAVFCVLGSGEIAGLAGWIALSALVLGSMADGGWLALVAGRRGVGLWGAMQALQGSRPSRRAEQERYWAALFGKDRQ